MSIKPEAIIYTDGSCLGNPGPGGWAAIVVSDGKEIELVGGDRHTTNNRMELLGVISALKALRGPHIVTVHSDSKYVTDAFNKSWLRSWKANGWARKDGELLNSDLWKELDKLATKHSCTFNWVKGHAGNEYNERADKLAVAESKRQAAGKGTVPASEIEPLFDVAEGETPFSDIPCETVYAEDDGEFALYCLDALLKENNLKEYGHKQPCGAHEWCENCGGMEAYECAYAYMKHQKVREGI